MTYSYFFTQSTLENIKRFHSSSFHRSRFLIWLLLVYWFWQSNNRPRMRIQDKNKIKNSKLSNGGQSTSINAISIHDCVESGDLIGLQRLLAHTPSLLNQTDNLVRSSVYFIFSLSYMYICVWFLAWILINLLFILYRLQMNVI